MRLISDALENKKNIVYVNNVENIESDDIFHRHDVFEVNEIREIFDLKGTPASFISDHMIHYEDFIDNVKFIGLPLFLERTRQDWNLDEFTETEYEINNCFNFMINKKQINRYLCIKLVELFKFKSFTYTWSGVDNYFDCSEIINEHQFLGKSSPLSSEQFSEILSPIKLESFFLYFNNTKTKNIQHNGSGVEFYGGNRNSWDCGLNKMFSESAVSLITESLSHQKASTFTEKTLYSVLGLSFPIWIGGGNRQAEMWKKLGFDTFDDVIDHDYQYYDTLLERCVYAFTFNKKILTDLEFAKSIRKKYTERLKNNRNLILSGKLNEYIQKELGNFPPTDNNLDNSFKNALNELLKQFKVDNCQFESP
jgi:hypothetical protein